MFPVYSIRRVWRSPLHHLTTVSVLVTLVACGGDAPPPDEAAPRETETRSEEGEPASAMSYVEAPESLDPQAASRAREIGAPAAAALAQGLLARLGEAIDERGTASAVEFCSLEAIPLTRDIEAAQEGDIGVKRTTLRPRNPDNAPDEAELQVLRYLESLEAVEPGSAPDALTAPGPEGELRYYRVLRTGPLCLQCHGTEDALAPGVREALATRYPDDRAIGYEAGELRGVIRVEVPSVTPAP